MCLKLDGFTTPQAAVVVDVAADTPAACLLIRKRKRERKHQSAIVVALSRF